MKYGLNKLALVSLLICVMSVGFVMAEGEVEILCERNNVDHEDGVLYRDDLEGLKLRGFAAINKLLVDRNRLIEDRDQLLEECRYLRNRLETFDGDAEAQRLHHMLKELERVLSSAEADSGSVVIGDDLIASAEGAIKELNRLRREKMMLQQQLVHQIASNKKSMGKGLKIFGGIVFAAVAIGLGVMIYRYAEKGQEVAEANAALEAYRLRIVENENLVLGQREQLEAQFVAERDLRARVEEQAIELAGARELMAGQQGNDVVPVVVEPEVGLRQDDFDQLRRERDQLADELAQAVQAREAANELVAVRERMLGEAGRGPELAQVNQFQRERDQARRLINAHVEGLRGELDERTERLQVLKNRNNWNPVNWARAFLRL